MTLTSFCRFTEQNGGGEQYHYVTSVSTLQLLRVGSVDILNSKDIIRM